MTMRGLNWRTRQRQAKPDLAPALERDAADRLAEIDQEITRIERRDRRGGARRLLELVAERSRLRSAVE